MIGIVLFPLLFMVHEFEEMMILPLWTRRHEAMLIRRAPRLRGRLAFLQSPAFMLAVLEEFAIVSACTIATLCAREILYWYFALLAFAIHLLPHIAQAVLLRRYVPAALTSLLCLPYCVWAVCQVWHAYSPAGHVAIATAATLFCVANLLAMHSLCPRLWHLIESINNK